MLNYLKYQRELPRLEKVCWKILKEIGIPDHLTCLLRNLYAGLELDLEQWTGSKLRKEYVKAKYHHPAYLTYMQSTLVKCWAG